MDSKIAIAKLTKALDSFTTNNIKRGKHTQSLNKVSDLFMSGAKPSGSTMHRHKNARDIFGLILQRIDSDLFFLCAITLTISEVITIGSHRNNKEDFVEGLKNWWMQFKIPSSFSNTAAELRQRYKKLLEVASRNVVLLEESGRQSSRDAHDADILTEDATNADILGQDTLIQDSPMREITDMDIPTRASTRILDTMPPTSTEQPSNANASNRDIWRASDHQVDESGSNPVLDTQAQKNKEIAGFISELEARLTTGCDLSFEEAITALLGNRKGAKLLRLNEDSYVCFKCNPAIATRLESKRMAEDDLFNPLASSTNPTPMEFP